MPEGPGLDIGAVVFTGLLAIVLAAEIGRALVARWVLRRRVLDATKTRNAPR